MNMINAMSLLSGGWFDENKLLLNGILLLVVFLIMTVVMSKRIMPAMLAMPILAVLICVIGGIKLEHIFQYVIGMGSISLVKAMVISMFGGMLSIMMQRTGIAEGFIKKGAELAGDNPFRISIIMFLFIIMLFTTLGGLGAIIMVGSIVLPILTSLGISRLTSGVILLMGVSLGGMFCVSNWVLYTETLGVTTDQVKQFVSIMFIIAFIGGIIYFAVELYKTGFNIKLKKILATLTIILVVLGGIIYIANTSNPITNSTAWQSVTHAMTVVGMVLYWVIMVAVLLLFVAAVYRAYKHRNKNHNSIHWTAVFTPIIPLFLILMFDVNEIAAFVIGIAYAFFVTYKRGNKAELLKSMIEGASVVMPAVILMIGIGWLLTAVKGPDTLSVADMQAAYGTDIWPIRAMIQPLIETIVPSGPVSYVIIFTVLAPLALFRGPLNVWGMGLGIAAILVQAGMPAAAILGMLWSVGQVQGISDPTNLQNVWVGNELKVDVQKIMFSTLPYSWAFALLGLIAAAILYY